MKVLVFTAPAWCMPCRRYEPIVAEFIKKHSEIQVEIYDMDEPASQTRASLYGVASVPTTVLINSKGEIADTLAGSMPLAVLEKMIAAIDTSS